MSAGTQAPVWRRSQGYFTSRAQRGATAPLGTGGSRPPGPTRASATGGAAWLPSRDTFQRAAISSARFHGQNPVTWGRAHRRNPRAEADSTQRGTRADGDLDLLCRIDPE